MEAPLFSIITINYNNLLGLERTTNSIFDQTFDDFNLVIIDGASVDGSVEFINSIISIKTSIITEKDDGIYDAMNKGIKSANGKYIIFMNSGDCFADNTVLGNTAEILNKSRINYEFLYGDTYELKSGRNELLLKKARNHTMYWYGMFTYHQSMFFSNELIRKYNLFYNNRYRISADWEFVVSHLKYISDESKIFKTNFPISLFEIGGASSNFSQGIKEQYSIRRNILKWNHFQCISISLLLYILNYIREYIPIFYKYFNIWRAQKSSRQ